MAFWKKAGIPLLFDAKPDPTFDFDANPDADPAY
jgi:hypothetical protein